MTPATVARRSFVIGVGIFALWLGLELSARVYLFGMAGLDPRRVDSVHSLIQTGFVRLSNEPRLTYELVPNVKGFFKLSPFRTNSRGLRDEEYPVEKPPGTFRVAVVGSSFAFPSGVAIEAAFHSLLEAQLSAERAPTRYEFVNFSVGMYDPGQVLAMLELRALDYDPDLVLMPVTDLAAPRLLEPSTRKAAREGEPTEAFAHSHPVLQSFLLRLIAQRLGKPPEAGPRVGLLEGWVLSWTPRQDPTIDPKRGPGFALKAWAAAGADQAGPVLDRLAGVGQRTNIPIVVVRLGIDPSAKIPADAVLPERCRELGLQFFSTREAFAGTRPSDFWIYELDPHPNAAAHAIFAQSLGAFLAEAQLLEPPVE